MIKENPMKKESVDRIVAIIKKGGIGVIPTDTIYGLVGSAFMPKTVERVYQVRQRHPKKPMLVLIEKSGDLARFGVFPNAKQRQHIKELWPGPVSMIFPCKKKGLSYLHRGSHTIAFRVPAYGTLRQLLRRTGPLVAPSANPEGLLPAHTIRQAKEYFGDSVDFYLSGKVKKKTSTVIDLTGQTIAIKRA